MPSINQAWLRKDPWLGLGMCLLVIGHVAIATFLLRGVLPYPDETYRSWDHNKYIAMAQDPFSDDPALRQAPRIWRPATPLVVFASPFPLKVSFYLVSLTGVFWAAYFLYLYLKDLKFEARYRVYGIVLFATAYYTVGFHLWDHYLPDPLGLASFALAFLLFGRRRYVLLGTVLAAAVLNKEVILLLFPAFLLIGLSRDDRTHMAKNTATVVAVFLPAIIVAATIRMLLDPVGEYNPMKLADFYFDLRFNSGLVFLSQELVRWSFLTWGVLAVLFLVDPIRRLKQIVLDRPWQSVFLVSIGIQLLFARDTERLLIYAFPVMVPIALVTIENLSNRLNISDLRLTLLLLVPHLGLFLVLVTKETNAPRTGLMTMAAILLTSWVVIQTALALRIRSSPEQAFSPSAASLFPEQ